MEQTTQNEIGKFIRIIAIVIVIFFAFYLITIFTTGRKKGEYTKKQTTPAVIQYEEIILGNLYQQSANSYYVLIEEKDDPYNTLFENLLRQNNTKEGGIPYYTSDLSSAFNQRFIGSTASFEPGNLKVNGTTLLKIENGTVTAHYETSESILEFLKTLNA